MIYSSLGTSENHVVTKFVLVTMETVQSNYDFSWGSDGRPLYHTVHKSTEMYYSDRLMENCEITTKGE